MNTSKPASPEGDDRLSFLERLSRYQDGLLNAAEAAELADEINSDPTRREEFIQWQIRSAAIYDIEQREAVSNSVSSIALPTTPFRRLLKSSGPGAFWLRPQFLWIGGTLLAILLVAIPVSRMFLPVVSRGDRIASPAATIQGEPNVLLTEEVGASFVGSVPLKAGSSLQAHQNYFLTNGLIRLSFSGGATAIIEAPAMFHIRDENSLALEIGSCSVHAPDGAEGFRVITPVTDVVDRGTRFSVKVHDNSDTEVHVIEGIADLYPLADSGSPVTVAAQTDRLDERNEPIRLRDHQAIRIGAFRNDAYEMTSFNPDVYRQQLPDRVVRYQATNADGLADELMNITVQRGGELRTYSVEELIPIEVIWFHGEAEPEKSGHLAGGPVRPEQPQEWLEDRKLHTGFMNIGGQSEPLTSDPVLSADARGTPGLGIRFRTPVVNRPGPDVILFDVQHYLQTLDGDPFHVSPLHFRPGLQTLTVRRFDLTVNSPESLIVPPFWRHRYSEPVKSLAELATASSQANLRSSPMPVQAIAVGIDLSDLGFTDGEQVNELFFQHAMEEALPNSRMGIPSKIDPVYIAGLPELQGREDRE